MFVTLQFLLVIMLCTVILIQKTDNMGMGIYSNNDPIFGIKNNFLTKLTFLLGLLFILNTLYLNYYYNTNTNSILETIDIEQINKK